MDQFERRRLVVGVIAFLLFALIALAFAIPHIEDDRASATEKQLQKAGITDVKVSFDGQDGTLTGPATLEAAALAAVKDRTGIRSLTYETPTTTVPGAAGPTTAPRSGATTTARAAATTAAPAAALGVNGTVNGNTLTLTGGVPTAADKQALHAAAATGFGAKVADQVQVVGGAWDPASKKAFDGLRTYVAAAGPRLQSGDLAISGGNLSAGGVAFSKDAAASLNQTLAKLKAGGVAVNAAIQDPPAVDAAGLQNNLNALLERTGINFASASAAIDAHSKLVLDTAAQAIEAGPTAQIQINGYTDNVGPEAQNKTLSLQRAQAVRLYLIQKGVAAGRLKAAGFGSTKPIADNATAAGRAANRRIEFTVTGS